MSENEARILYTVEKKAFLLQGKGAHFKKFAVVLHTVKLLSIFLASLCVAQHGVFTFYVSGMSELYHVFIGSMVVTYILHVCNVKMHNEIRYLYKFMHRQLR